MISIFHRLLSKVWRLRIIQIFIPSKLFCLIEYKHRTNTKLNLSHPKTFNEKIQWLKIYDLNPSYTLLVDKYEVRNYIKDTIGEKYLVSLIGVYNSVEEIPFDQLPDEYVLKCTHDSGTIVIKNKNSTDTVDEIKRKLRKALKRNYYYEHREWPYKGIKPRIVCEEYLVDESGFELKDYKIHCFEGKPKLIQVDFGRFSSHKRNLYDENWNYIDGSILYPNDPSIIIDKPSSLFEMLEIASKLSSPFLYVRVDLYIVGDKIFFGELTFHHGAGYEEFRPKELGLQMGEWLKLPIN